MKSASGGFTLFEVLVSLAILALVMAVSATALRGPSPSILLQQAAGVVQKETALARDQAIKSRRIVELPLKDLSCDDERPVVWFFPDGSARGPDVCLSEQNLSLRLKLDALLGRYETEAES